MTREEYIALLNEASQPELDPSRQVEIHTALSSGINGLFEEKEQLSSQLIDARTNLDKHRDAMALMYSQLHAEKIKGSNEEIEKEDFQQSITINDLLGKK